MTKFHSLWLSKIPSLWFTINTILLEKEDCLASLKILENVLEKKEESDDFWDCNLHRPRKKIIKTPGSEQVTII
jgi:hypothetical protein